MQLLKSRRVCGVIWPTEEEKSGVFAPRKQPASGDRVQSHRGRSVHPEIGGRRTEREAYVAQPESSRHEGASAEASVQKRVPFSPSNRAGRSAGEETIGNWRSPAQRARISSLTRWDRILQLQVVRGRFVHRVAVRAGSMRRQQGAAAWRLQNGGRPEQISARF